MQFDRFTVTLLTLCPDPPSLDAAAVDALQDEHMAYLAGLLAAGPLLGSPDRPWRGLSIWRGEPDAVRGLLEENPDPMVTAGRLRHEIIPWMVPGGALHFAPTHFPRSMAEAEG